MANAHHVRALATHAERYGTKFDYPYEGRTIRASGEDFPFEKASQRGLVSVISAKVDGKEIFVVEESLETGISSKPVCAQIGEEAPTIDSLDGYIEFVLAERTEGDNVASIRINLADSAIRRKWQDLYDRLVLRVYTQFIKNSN